MSGVQSYINWDTNNQVKDFVGVILMIFLTLIIFFKCVNGAHFFLLFFKIWHNIFGKLYLKQKTQASVGKKFQPEQNKPACTILK